MVAESDNMVCEFCALAWAVAPYIDLQVRAVVIVGLVGFLAGRCLSLQAQVCPHLAKFGARHSFDER